MVQNVQLPVAYLYTKRFSIIYTVWLYVNMLGVSYDVCFAVYYMLTCEQCDSA